MRMYATVRAAAHPRGSAVHAGAARGSVLAPGWSGHPSAAESGESRGDRVGIVGLMRARSSGIFVGHATNLHAT